MNKLPEAFQKEMKELLQEAYPAFLESMDESSYNGLRLNSLKWKGGDPMKILPFGLSKVPWIPNGYYYTEGNPSRDPFYYAGLYYLQEPSAMTPASRLPVEPGDFVLDLCAAPGGKATELGARLQGKGILLANDISNSRAKALLKNLELFGISNAYVTSEKPERLAAALPEFFDKILVDAPCSGEGMFRRDPRMISHYEEQGPEYYASIQKDLILQAADLLRPGGMLLYSTCTFSVKENEETIAWLLSHRPQMKTVPIGTYEGFAAGVRGLTDCVRIFPHKMGGEGHFLALLQKEGSPKQRKKGQEKSDSINEEAAAFLKECRGLPPDKERLYRLKNDHLYLLKKEDRMPDGLRYLRTGLYVGDCKGKRFEPSQALAMALSQNGFSSVIELKHEDERVIRYLKGETLDVSDLSDRKAKGWQLITVEGYPLGWGKIHNGLLKNKYYAGWRWQ